MRQAIDSSTTTSTDIHTHVYRHNVKYMGSRIYSKKVIPDVKRRFETPMVFYWSFEHISWRSVYIISTGLDRERGCALLYVVSQTGSFYYREFLREVVFHSGGLLWKTVLNHSGYLNQAPQCVWYADNHQNHRVQQLSPASSSSTFMCSPSPRIHQGLTAETESPRDDPGDSLIPRPRAGLFSCTGNKETVTTHVLRRIRDNCPTRIKHLSENTYLAHIWTTHSNPRSDKCCPISFKLSISRWLKILFFLAKVGVDDRTFCFSLSLVVRDTSPSSLLAPFRADTTRAPLVVIPKPWPPRTGKCSEDQRDFFDGGGVNPPSLSLPGESSLQSVRKRRQISNSRTTLSEHTIQSQCVGGSCNINGCPIPSLTNGASFPRWPMTNQEGHNDRLVAKRVEQIPKFFKMDDNEF